MTDAAGRARGGSKPRSGGSAAHRRKPSAPPHGLPRGTASAAVRIVGDAAEIAEAISRSKTGRAGWPRMEAFRAGHDVEVTIVPLRRKTRLTDRRADVVPMHGFEPSPKARALLHGVEIAEADLATGDGTFRLEDVQRLLRISRQAIDKKVKQDDLLAVPGPGNERRYPAFQFRLDGVLPGLRNVLRALPSRNPWFRLHFLVNAEPRLGGRRPFELLQQGEHERVVEAARRIGEMGA